MPRVRSRHGALAVNPASAASYPTPRPLPCYSDCGDNSNVTDCFQQNHECSKKKSTNLAANKTTDLARSVADYLHRLSSPILFFLLCYFLSLFFPVVCFALNNFRLPSCCDGALSILCFMCYFRTVGWFVYLDMYLPNDPSLIFIEKRRQYDNARFESINAEGIDMEIDLTNLGTVNTMFAALFRGFGVLGVLGRFLVGFCVLGVLGVWDFGVEVKQFKRIVL
ncbi:hypothetical protein LXL04_027559 [Taraxacum kok-saghyz]